jgi:hypothetical protein
MDKQFEDLTLHGISITNDGKRIAPQDFYKKPKRSMPLLVKVAIFGMISSVAFIIYGLIKIYSLTH